MILEINKNRKGKEYYSDGKIKFEGEYHISENRALPKRS